MSEPGGLRAVLDDVAAVGPFFALELPGPAETGSWVRLSELPQRPAPLTERISRVRDALGSDDRVAASIAFQGLVARLVAGPLAAVVLHGVLPDPSGLSRCPDGADPWAPGLLDARALATPDPARDPAGAADVFGAALVDGLVAPLLETVRALVRVSPTVLWGNVASSLAGGARVLDGARPGARPVLLGVLAALLDRPPLAATGGLLRAEPGGPDGGWAFRRRSCCLYHRVPGGGLCGDCVLSSR